MMRLAPGPGTPHTDTAAVRFLSWLYEAGRGYIEIVAGIPRASDPSQIDMLMSTRRWCYYDPERPDLIGQTTAYAAELAAQYGNVYVGIRLYSRQAREANTRSEAATLPSRVIFIDDAPTAPPLPYSASIRTSEGGRHAYYKCDRPVTKDDARRAAALLGGDPSGVDLTQLVRVPHTFNTKNGERFPVQPEITSGPIYRLDDLRAQLPTVEPARTRGLIEPLNWPEVETHLANIKGLLSCARSQMIKPSTQTGRILAGEMLAFSSERYHKMDDSRTMNACAAALGFYLRGYMDDEIAAVVYHLYERWGKLGEKGTAWVRGDIHRILSYCHEEHPEVKQSPTRYRKAQTAEPLAYVLAPSRARADRPHRLEPPTLLARYQAEPALCKLKRKSRAASLQISTATLDRLEDALERDGLITIETDPQRRGSKVILRDVINIGADEVLSGTSAAVAPDQPSVRTESAQTDDRGPQCIGETHPPPEAPCPAPPIAAAVRQAITAIEQPTLDVETGEITRLSRANPDRVRAWLTECWPDLDTTEVEEVYPEVRKEMQRQHQQEQARAFWAAERERVRDFTNDQLLAALGGCVSRLAAAERKRPGSPWARRCAALFAIHDEERRRRGLSQAKAPRDRASRKAATARTVKVAQALHRRPEQPEAPAQAAFVNLVEDVAWLPPVDQGRTGAVCSPHPTSEAPPTSGLLDQLPNPSDVIARLKARSVGAAHGS